MVEATYFKKNKKGEYQKTCDNCLTKNKMLREKETKPIEQQIEPVSKTTIVFDVEHSGGKEKEILQLTWCLYDGTNSLTKTHNYYVKPSGYIHINPYVSEKIGLTYESLLLKSNSLPLKELLTLFIDDVKMCGTLVSHNICADLATLNDSLIQNGFNKLNTNTYCTMNNTKTYCNLKDIRGRLKNPTLTELYLKLFNKGVDIYKLHDSNYDVELCAQCYFKFVHNVPLICKVEETLSEVSTAISTTGQHKPLGKKKTNTHRCY
jgi:hypothetical protein